MDKVHQKIISQIDQVYTEDQLSNGTFNKTSNIGVDLTIATQKQFTFITRFPHFSLTHISKEFKEICGQHNDLLNIRSILNIIHPQDIDIVASSYKNACQFILNNYSNLPLGADIFSIEFRIKDINGNYIKLRNTNTLHEKLNWEKGFKLFSECSIVSSCNDVNNIRTSKKKSLKREHILIFTARELQILHLLALGKSSCEIGLDLEISKHTVDTHRRKMLAKSKLANTAELIATSISNGLIVS